MVLPRIVWFLTGNLLAATVEDSMPMFMESDYVNYMQYRSLFFVFFCLGKV